MTPHDAVLVAALANASWCDAVCRTHRIPTEQTPTRWFARARTPLGYPDAVTLTPGLDPAAVLDGTAPGRGRSVKDSFADLDLVRAGFEALFEASWIAAEPDPRPPALPWLPVVDAAGLDRWRTAHDLPTAFRPELLAEPGLRLFAVDDGAMVVAGVAVNAVRGGVAVSNLFTTGPEPAAVWADLPRLAAQVGPGVVTGYESGPDLDLAVRAGFVAQAPLRVWMEGRTPPIS